MVAGYTPRVDPRTGAKIVDYQVISSDSHVVEPRDLWTARIDKEFRDRAMHVETRGNADWWVIDGVAFQGVEDCAQPGYMFDKDKRRIPWSPEGLFVRDLVRGGYDPDERVKDMDTDGVAKEILHPTLGNHMGRVVVDGRALSAHVRAYNDWVAEFSRSQPKRLYGLCCLNVDDVQEAAEELRRCHRMGLVGAMLPWPSEDRPYSLPEYEVLWATAEDLGIPLEIHAGTRRTTPAEGIIQTKEMGKAKPPGWGAQFQRFKVAIGMTQLILGGALERHPKLQFGFVEVGLAWALPVLQSMDDTERRSGLPNRFKNGMVPSDFFHRQMFLGYQYDEIGIRLRHYIGVENIQWGSDYPHRESTWPHSAEVLEENLAECTYGERVKIAGGNGARVFHLHGG